MFLSRSNGEAVLHIVGTLRAPMTGDLVRRVERLLQDGERCIVLSLAGVFDLDAAGIGALVRAHNLTEAAGGHFRIVDPGGRSRVLLAQTGLLDILETCRR